LQVKQEREESARARKLIIIRFRDSKTTGPQPGVFLAAASFLSGSFDQNLVETETPLELLLQNSLSAAAA
jgi:hypothetical protein